MFFLKCADVFWGKVGRNIEYKKGLREDEILI